MAADRIPPWRLPSRWLGRGIRVHLARRRLRTRLSRAIDGLLDEFPDFDFTGESETVSDATWDLVVRLDQLQSYGAGRGFWRRGRHPDRLRREFFREAREIQDDAVSQGLPLSADRVALVRSLARTMWPTPRASPAEHRPRGVASRHDEEE